MSGLEERVAKFFQAFKSFLPGSHQAVLSAWFTPSCVLGSHLKKKIVQTWFKKRREKCENETFLKDKKN